MTGNEESDQVIENALLGHLLAILGIEAVKHGGKQILARIQIPLGLALLQDLIGRLSHHLNVAEELFVLSPVEIEGIGNLRARSPLSVKKSPIASTKG